MAAPVASSAGSGQPAAPVHRSRRLLALVTLVALAPTPSAATGGEWLVDVSEEVGLRFVHFNGRTGDLYFPEMTGQGAALLDYDGDGDLDLYLVQGSWLGPGGRERALDRPTDDPPRARLLRNDLLPAGQSGPRLSLVDVTEAAGLAATGYGMGVATGDVDGDGDVDLFATNYGPDELWRNRGDGTFEPGPPPAGGWPDEWSTSATFFDADGDGDLDLFVATYVAFDVAANPRCYAPSSRRDYCGPADFPPLPDRLWRNRGDGTFEDVSLPSGIAALPGAGLGVVAADLDGDGRSDVYVANDGMPNRLWSPRGDGTFADVALLAGVAVDGEGRAEASMGVDAGDFDGDGDEDVFLTHLTGETDTLYVNEGDGLFADRTAGAGLGVPSLPFTSFGTAWADLDADGWLDLFVANGAVRLQEARAGLAEPLAQADQLFVNLGGRRFVEVGDGSGEVFGRRDVGRGAAFGDVDDDGDPDILLANNGGAARLLASTADPGSPGGAGWLGVAPRDRSGAPATGVRVELRRPARPTLVRRARADGSYCSANDPRVLFGLGGEPAVASLAVHWPAGRSQVVVRPPIGVWLELPRPVEQ